MPLRAGQTQRHLFDMSYSAVSGAGTEYGGRVVLASAHRLSATRVLPYPYIHTPGTATIPIKVA
eukprot:2814841-Rhodomonas_salina.4